MRRKEGRHGGGRKRRFLRQSRKERETDTGEIEGALGKLYKEV